MRLFHSETHHKPRKILFIDSVTEEQISLMLGSFGRSTDVRKHLQELNSFHRTGQSMFVFSRVKIMYEHDTNDDFVNFRVSVIRI